MIIGACPPSPQLLSDRFTVVGGGLFAAVLVLGTALRGLVGREADAASAGPRGDAAVVENGKVCRATASFFL